MGALRKPAASNIGLEYSVTRPPRPPLLYYLAKLSLSDVTMRGLALTTRPLVPLVPLAGPDAAKPPTYLKLACKNDTSIQCLGSFSPPYRSIATRYLPYRQATRMEHVLLDIFDRKQ